MATEETQDQSIADILNDAYDQVEAGEKPAEPEALEIDEPKDPEIDAPADDGKPADAPKEDAPKDEPKEPVQPEEGDEDEPEQPDPEDRAPSSWKADVAAKWAEVPPEVRAEIQRRETDYHKGIEQYKQFASIGRDIERVIAPHMQTIQQLGVHPMEAIGTLLNADAKLRYGTPEQKSQYFGQLAQEYGIDLAKVQPPAPVDPAVLELRQQNQQLQRFQQSVIEQQNQTVMSEIEQFKANPANVHFEAVKDDMAILLQSNRAESLQDAYDKAVWMRPDIRKSLVEQQRTEAEQKAATLAREKRAKAAAGGIKGSGTSKSGALNPNSSLRDTIAAAMDGNV